MKIKNIEREVVKEERLLFHFIKRGFIGMVIIFLFISIGVLFYVLVEDMPLLDAIYHTSMIITGLGPVVLVHTPLAKIFTSVYAILSIGLVVSSILFIFEPLFRRWHRRTYESFRGKLKNGKNKGQ